MYRIAFLVTRPDQIGGSHIHVRDIAAALKNDGHEVVVFMGGPGPVVDHFRSFGLEVAEIPSIKRNISPVNDVKAYFRLKKAIADFQPDIITAHSSKAGYLGRLVGWKLGIPVIFTAHGWSFTDGKNSFKQTFYRLLEKSVVPITDKIIAVSDYDRKLALEELQIPEDLILTVHNGMTDIEENFLTNQEVKEGPINIVMVARFDHQKDQAELIKAAHTIENIHIHFVGDGHLRKNAEILVSDLEMEDKFTFWGELDSVVEVLAKCQVFALISNWEGFPCSTLEAMRAGMPTVVSDVGGSAEAIEQGKTGYAIKKGDVEGLRAVLKELAENSSKRAAMGLEARKRFENLYTFNHMYEKTLAVYRDVINSRNKQNS